MKSVEGRRTMKNKLVGIILVFTLVAIVFAGCTGEEEKRNEVNNIDLKNDDLIDYDYNVNISKEDLLVMVGHYGYLGSGYHWVFVLLNRTVYRVVTNSISDNTRDLAQKELKICRQLISFSNNTEDYPYALYSKKLNESGYEEIYNMVISVDFSNKTYFANATFLDAGYTEIEIFLDGDEDYIEYYANMQPNNETQELSDAVLNLLPEGPKYWADFPIEDIDDRADENISISWLTVRSYGIEEESVPEPDLITFTINYEFSGTCSEDVESIELYYAIQYNDGPIRYNPLLNWNTFEHIILEPKDGTWEYSYSYEAVFSKEEKEALNDTEDEPDYRLWYLAVGWTEDGHYNYNEEKEMMISDDDDDDDIAEEEFPLGLVLGITIPLIALVVILIVFLIIIFIFRMKKKVGERQ